jgi:hypothetical protein
MSTAPKSNRTTHTPGPWKAGEAAWFRGRANDDTESGKRPITSGAHGVIANVYGSANAEFIVRACNAHDELLAALKELRAAITVGSTDDGKEEISRDVHFEVALKADAAIAKAEGR